MGQQGPILAVTLLILSSTCGWASANTLQLRDSVNFAYFLGNSFLDLIRGKEPTNASLEVIYKIITVPEQSLSFNQIQPVLYSYLGYIICVAFGLLFAILMPLVALFFCCCRCCGNCGGAKKAMDTRHATCKRVFFTISLAIINTVMLVGVVLACINNHLIHEAVVGQDDRVSACKQFNTSLTDIDAATSDMFQTFKNRTTLALTNESTPLRNVIKGGFLELQREVLAHDIVKEHLRIVNNIKTNMAQTPNFNSTATDYRTKAEQLESVLREARDELDSVCPQQSSRCSDLVDRVRGKLVISFDLQKVDLKGGSEMATRISNTEKKELDEVIKLFQNMAEVLEAEMKSSVDTFVSEMVDPNSKPVKRLFDFLDEINRWISGVLRIARQRFLSHERMMLRGGDESASFSNNPYTWQQVTMYGGYGVCSLLLLIIFFYYLGLCFGTCGERPFDDAGSCNRGVGANLLMAGVGFSFIFSTLIMLLCVILFLVGGLLDTEFCRYASQRYPNGPQVLDSMFKRMMPLAGTVSLSSDQDNMMRLIDETWMFEGVLERCEKEPLGAWVRVEKVSKRFTRNITKQSVEDNLKPLFDKLRSNAQPRQKFVDKLTPAVNDFVNRFAYLDSANFSASIIETARLTQVNDLKITIRNIEEAGGNVPTLRNRVLPLEVVRIELHDKFRAMEALKSGRKNFTDQWDSLVSNIDSTFRNILTSPFKDKLVSMLVEECERVFQWILDGTACAKLRLGNKKALNAVCVTALYPFNGFWYGLGICVILFIPSIIFAVKLAGLYRKTEKFASDYEEPDYVSYQGFYMHPGDNVPLERSSKQRSAGKSSGHKGTRCELDADEMLMGSRL